MAYFPINDEKDELDMLGAEYEAHLINDNLELCAMITARTMTRELYYRTTHRVREFFRRLRLGEIPVGYVG